MVEAVAYGLETFFCEVAGYVENVEEFESLGEGISSGKVKRCKSGLSVPDLNNGDHPAPVETYTILKLAFCRRHRAFESRNQRPSG